MKLLIKIIFILFLLSPDTVIFGQLNRLELKRVKPNGWFSILVPKNSKDFLSHASVDGGNIDSKEIEIEFHYWQNGDAPLYVKNTKDAYLVCSNKLQSKTWNTVIDGKKAIAQTCFDKKDSEFIYHVAFLRLKVPEVEQGTFRYGMFNLTITYKDKIYLETVRKIAKSLRFE